MHLKNLENLKVCILGFGKEGQAMLKTIEDNGINADITITDKNQKLETKNYKTICGDNYLKELDNYDLVIKSPGIPPCSELDSVKDKLTNSTQIFLDTVKEAGSIVIGVTGSKGKSTTVSLIHEILKNAGKNSYLVGNIGEPSITYINKAGSDVFFVLEMSSYQLMQCTTSPQIAVVTSFFPEHLDYHGSVENYLEAKKNIAKFQGEDDVIFYNDAPPNDATQGYLPADIANESKGQKFSFSKPDSPVALEETKLLGTHNLINIAASYKVSEYLNIPEDKSIEAIKNFTGLPHRLQNLGEHNGIIWVDDSISTTPETAIAALDALGDQVMTIILGGQDRGNDFSELGKRIASSKIQNVILMGESGSRIKESIESAGAEVGFFEANNMEEAVRHAKQETKNQKPKTKKPICLLSPASPSYDQYKNFEEKGDLYTKCIRS